MSKREIIINGNNFSDLDGFYDEAEKVLTKNLDWKIGKNLDAFNDVLRGGFGVHEYEEPIKVIWKKSRKSKEDLGYKETIKHLKDKLMHCHPTAIELIQKEIKLAKRKQSKILFDTILDIIKGHDQIQLVLE